MKTFECSKCVLFIVIGLWGYIQMNNEYIFSNSPNQGHIVASGTYADIQKSLDLSVYAGEKTGSTSTDTIATETKPNNEHSEQVDKELDVRVCCYDQFRE